MNNKLNFSDRLNKIFNFSNKDLDKEAISKIGEFIDANKNKYPNGLDKVGKRIAYIDEFDNGNVIHDWKKIPVIDAEIMARDSSIKDKEHTYYVAYDDVMLDGSGLKWKNGKLV